MKKWILFNGKNTFLYTFSMLNVMTITFFYYLYTKIIRL